MYRSRKAAERDVPALAHDLTVSSKRVNFSSAGAAPPLAISPIWPLLKLSSLTVSIGWLFTEIVNEAPLATTLIVLVPVPLFTAATLARLIRSLRAPLISELTITRWAWASTATLYQFESSWARKTRPQVASSTAFVCLQSTSAVKSPGVWLARNAQVAPLVARMV